MSTETIEKNSSHEEVWSVIQEEVRALKIEEPALTDYFDATILTHHSLEAALGHILSRKLGTVEIPAEVLKDVICEAFMASEEIRSAIREDIIAVYTRDPACTTYWNSVLYLKGFHALQSYRVSNWLWQEGRRSFAMYLQSRISEAFDADIHPAAKIGKGIMIDHATSVVIGETAVVEDDVSLLHEVTLGGTGKESGDRHPKVRKGVLIGAGAKILGNVNIGEGSKIGAGSVVLDDVPPHSTAVGVPAEVVGETRVEHPALLMDHRLFGLKDKK